MKHGADTGAQHGERRGDDKERRREAIADRLQGDTVAFMANLHKAYRGIERECAVLSRETGTLPPRYGIVRHSERQQH